MEMTFTELLGLSDTTKKRETIIVDFETEKRRLQERKEKTKC